MAIDPHLVLPPLQATPFDRCLCQHVYASLLLSQNGYGPLLLVGGVLCGRPLLIIELEITQDQSEITHTLINLEITHTLI